jgi:hypothetical protein
VELKNTEVLVNGLANGHELPPGVRRCKGKIFRTLMPGWHEVRRIDWYSGKLDLLVQAYLLKSKVSVFVRPSLKASALVLVIKFRCQCFDILALHVRI